MRVSHLVFLLVAFTAVSLAQETNFSEGPQYLSLTGTAMLRPIATKSFSLDAPLPALPSLPEVGPEVTTEPYVSDPLLEHQPDLFSIYYGYPLIPVVELVATESTPELPPSISGIGFITLTDAQTLRELGYGITVAEAASFWRSRHGSTAHVYTNADIQRLSKADPRMLTAVYRGQGPVPW